MEEEISIEDQVDNLDATISALIEVLIEKKIISQREFDGKLATYYEEPEELEEE